MMWFVGQKVVCITDLAAWMQKYQPLHSAYHPRVPAKGEVLTIREIQSNPGEDFLAFTFEEIVSAITRRPVDHKEREQPFAEMAFRPLVEIERTEKAMAMLRDILKNPQPMVDA